MEGQRILSLVTVATLVFAVGLSANLPDTETEERKRSLQLVQPTPEVLALVSFNHAAALADLAWLDVIQTFGGADGDLKSTDWPRVAYMANVAVDLDPRYLTVYDAASLMLSLYGKRHSEAEALLMKGVKALPDSVRLPFMLGYIAYFERGEAEKASDWMRIAGTKPGAPKHLVALAGSLRARKGDRTGAIALIESTIPQLTGAAKEDAEWRLGALRSEARLERFDAACVRYKMRTGLTPTTGAELVASGDIKEPAVDDFGDPIEIDNHCYARSPKIRTREFERFKQE